MRPHALLLSTLPFAAMLFDSACTRPPPDPPGLHEQPSTTPKTPALEPTVTHGADQSEWPQAEQVAPGRDDPDLLGTSEAPVGTPDPEEVRAQPR